jgi:Flp pilus assembly protein TadG
MGLRRFTARLRASTKGVALTEFAMSVPVLLTLGLFGLETANLAMAHLRISNIAMLTADNASRVRNSIDEADVIELFTGAKMTGSSINFAQNGRIVLSSIERNAAGNGQWIRWQRCDGARNFTSAYGNQGRGQNDTTLQYVGTSTNPISAAAGTAVMLAEVSYQYQPIIPNSFLTGIEVRYESAFNVRQRTNQAITNTNSVTARNCNTYQA